MRHTIIILLTIILSTLHAKAQQDVSFVHYWDMQSFYNPAATAIEGKLDAGGTYSNQLTGFEYAPKTFYFGVDLPVYFLTPAHGAGISLLNDNAGLFSHMRVSVQYAYHQKLGRGMRVSGGIRFSLLTEKFDGSKVDIIDSGDPVIPTSSVSGSGFDIDFGLRFDYKKLWYAGVSMLHLTSPTISYGDDKIYEYHTSSTFYLTGGYNIKFRSPLFNMQLDAIVRTNLSAWRGDVTARLFYYGERRHMYFGLGYSPINSVTLLLGGEVHNFVIGYGYEILTGGIGFTHGNHEIRVGYKADLDLFKKGRNLHKSVRHL